MRARCASPPRRTSPSCVWAGSTDGGGADGSAAGPVAGTPVFAEGVRVSAAGDVTLPLIGVVHAEGLSTAGVERAIARRLVAEEILRAPQVSVQIAEYRSRVVAV